MWSYLDWWFSGDVCNEKVHSNIFTVHVFADVCSDVLVHPVCIQVHVILQWRTIYRNLCNTLVKNICLNFDSHFRFKSNPTS